MAEEKEPDSKRQNHVRALEIAGPEGFASSHVPDVVEYALMALATAANVTGLPLDPEGLLRAFPSRNAEEIPIILLRAAKKIGLKAKIVQTIRGLHVPLCFAKTNSIHCHTENDA